MCKKNHKRPKTPPEVAHSHPLDPFLSFANFQSSNSRMSSSEGVAPRENREEGDVEQQQQQHQEKEMAGRRGHAVYVTFEGNIGAGKSTLLRELLAMLRSKLDANETEVVVQEEPVDGWLKNGLLQKFYDDPKEYAFAFQMQVMQNRIDAEASTYANADDYVGMGRDVVVLQERSRESDRIFAATQAEDGNIDATRLCVYDAGVELWQRLLPNRTTCTVYLRTKPKSCLANVKSRARDSEGGGVSLDYLRRLHAAHEMQLEEAWRSEVRDRVVVDYENSKLADTCRGIAGHALRLLAAECDRSGETREATRRREEALKLFGEACACQQ